MRNQQRTPQFEKQLCQMQRPEQGLAIDAVLWIRVCSRFTLFTHPNYTIVNYWTSQGRIAGLKICDIFAPVHAVFQMEAPRRGLLLLHYTFPILPTHCVGQ